MEFFKIKNKVPQKLSNFLTCCNRDYVDGSNNSYVSVCGHERVKRRHIVDVDNRFFVRFIISSELWDGDVHVACGQLNWAVREEKNLIKGTV